MAIHLQSFAEGLGWSLAGATGLDMPEAWKVHYREWIEKYKGPQMKYLERRLQERLEPKRYLSTAQSILCFGLYYFPGFAQGPLKISNYSWGQDYHEVLKKKLEKTVESLREQLGAFDYRLCVDTSPVLEKLWAMKAGLGWQGKNTLLIHPKKGSFLFLGEMITSLPLASFEESKPITDHCGTCTRCLEACPTDALEPYVLDAKKCISYWTLEHRGDFEDATPKYSEWLAGCDICQEVCPWNQKLIPLESGYDPSLGSIDAKDVLSSDWETKIQDIAAAYIPLKHWRRNLQHLEKNLAEESTNE